MGRGRTGTTKDQDHDIYFQCHDLWGKRKDSEKELGEKEGKREELKGRGAAEDGLLEVSTNFLPWKLACSEGSTAARRRKTASMIQLPLL